ncbi:hypothetical protein [Streptomyces harbinensis]
MTTHAARLYAVAASVLALVVFYVPELPDALILGVVGAVLGAGEAVQRIEDGKTAAAGRQLVEDQDDA